MKVISLVLFIFTLSIINCTSKNLVSDKKVQFISSQEEELHISDTLDSVKKIVGDKSKYLNNELDILLNDLPFSVKSYSTRNHNLKEMDGIVLSFYDAETTRRMQADDNVVTKPIYLYITWKTHVPVEKHIELWSKSTVKGKWNTDDQAYYSKQVVGDIVYSAFGR